MMDASLIFSLLVAEACRQQWMLPRIRSMNWMSWDSARRLTSSLFEYFLWSESMNSISLFAT